MRAIHGFIALALLFSAQIFAKDFTSEQKKKLQDVVRDQLLDSESAKFKLGKYQGGTVYCGLVNSKNSFGGYAGNAVFQVFVLPSGGYQFLGMGDGDSESVPSVTITQSCAEHGYKL
ncbi:hypothetical protein [Pseudomonas sp. Irchel s3f7]|uniref:hypothetical protein n=1 Tax=Pseudomonas sp. Irchel s3f7 TaxID=2009153 RepID=UPI000BA3AE78|nr:hypothetical protein [Pseudomonas sp. Irchel s3f7]